MGTHQFDPANSRRARNWRRARVDGSVVTAPRQILPGQLYLLTRRCTQRQYLLRPDETTTQIFLYTLGEAAARFGVELIAWHASSNHYHAVVYDPSGNLPLFLERFHKLCARALNARWKRWENFWAAEATCAVRLIEDADVLDKVVYALANPVTDHLVDRVFDWPGASSLRYTAAVPRTITVARPRIFFRETGPLPEKVTLVVAAPPAHRDDRGAWAARVHEAVRDKERAAREERLATGGRVAGRRRILAASAFDRPTTHEPRGNLRPHVACLNRERRIRELVALRRFRVAHAEARRQFAAGQRDVLFPAGTFQMRVLFGARCAAPS
jgi:REP element-mobilizing transposase RayT